MERKLIKNDFGYEVLTPSGFQPFAGIATMGTNNILRITFSDGSEIDCSPGHGFVLDDGSFIRADEIEVGAKVIGRDATVSVLAILDTARDEETLSLIEVSGGHMYFTEGVASKNCEFVSDDETLINPLTLARLQSVQPEFYTGTVRWFSGPVANRSYLVALDPSLGTGRDYAAIQIFELPGMAQVGEWQHNHTAPRGQIRTLLQVLTFIDAVLRDDPDHSGDPEIYWTIENNSIGEALLQIVEDTGEERFPGMMVSERKRKGQSGRFRKGMNTDNRKKLSACARLKSLVESDRTTIKSAQLLKELKNFVSKEASFAGKPGEHDDLVSAMLLIVRMLDVVLQWGADPGDLKETIGEEELYDDGPLPVVL